MSKIVKLKQRFDLAAIQKGQTLLINSSELHWVDAQEWVRSENGANFFKITNFVAGETVVVSSVIATPWHRLRWIDVYFDNDTKLLNSVDASVFNKGLATLMPINYSSVWRQCGR